MEKHFYFFPLFKFEERLDQWINGVEANQAIRRLTSGETLEQDVFFDGTMREIKETNISFASPSCHPHISHIFAKHTMQHVLIEWQGLLLR